jgi:hypothetical protein
MPPRPATQRAKAKQWRKSIERDLKTACTEVLRRHRVRAPSTIAKDIVGGAEVDLRDLAWTHWGEDGE